MPRTPSGNSSSHAPSASLSRSVFPQIPAFSLDTFSDRDFIVKDFVESLTDNAIPPNRKSGPATNQATTVDAKPLIRSFENALNRMSELSDDLELRENELSAAVRRAEAHYASNIQSLSNKLDQTVNSLGGLDSSLTGGDDYDQSGDHVVKIGDRLEDLDRQRQRALDAKFLVQCWLEVSERGELYRLEELRRSGKGEGKVQCANVARQLLNISHRLDPDSWVQTNGSARGLNGVNGAHKQAKDTRKNTRELIEKFLETLEKDLLRSFDEFYRRQNFNGMRDCARVLHDFNDGSSVIGAFVNQHQFFIDRRQLITEDIEGEAELWERLADPDAVPPGVEASLQNLVDEVRTVVQEESIIIKRAFPYAEQVLAKFIQRVFQQSIQQKLELVLEKAGSVSSLAFLRSLQAARSSISTLIDELKAHGLTEHPDIISPQITMVLDQQFDDLFVPYLVGSSYIEREKRNLEELYSSLLFKFTTYHARRRKNATTFMKSLAKSGSEMLAHARDHYVDRLGSSDLSPAQKRMLLRVAGLKDAESARTSTEMEFSEEDGLLSVDNVKRMLKWLAEAVGRGLELSSSNETAKDVSALLQLLLTHLGVIYIETALDAASDAAASQESAKTEPDFVYLVNIRPATSAMYLLSMTTRTVLVPLSTANVTVRRDMEKTASTAMDRLEEKVNSIFQRTIDAMMVWVNKLLVGQKKTDFRPRDDTPTGTGPGTGAATSPAWLEQLQTPTCQSIFVFMGKFHQAALETLSPSPNLLALLTEAAVALRTALLDHFKKFPVNAAGGIMVTKDISKYIELLKNWNLGPSFEPSFEVLTEIGNVFVIGPEALKERLRGKKGGAGAAATIGGGAASTAGTGGWDVGDLRPYVLRREDAGSVGVQAALSAM